MALTRVGELSSLRLFNILLYRSVASVFENFSIGLIEKTLSVFTWPRKNVMLYHCISFF